MSRHQVMLNEEHLAIWLNDLRTTDAPQAQGRLSRHLAFGEEFGRVGYCCLGRGEVCRGATPEGELTAGRALATAGFIEWLGIETDGTGIEWDIELDNPYIGCPEALVPVDERVSCSALNDDHRFTFAQIADMIDYFGIHGLRT